MRRSDISSAGFAFSCASSALCARAARSIPAMRSLIAVRSSGEEDPPGVALTSLTMAASFSDCARAVATSPRSEASDFSSASMRAADAGSGAAVAALPALDSTPAMRALRSSMTVELIWPAAGVAGIAGHPRIQPTPITSEAATAPETIATTQAEIGAAAGSGDEGCGDEGSWDEDPWDRGSSDGGWEICSGGVSSPAFRGSLDTSDASRSIVGGGRLARPTSGEGPMSSGLSSTISGVPLLAVTGRYQIRHVLLEYRFWSKPEPIR